MIGALYRAYANSTLVLREHSFMDQLLRRAVITVDQLKCAFDFQMNRLWGDSRTPCCGIEQHDSDETLLAVYCLKANPLTFDFVTFLGITEMERIRRGHRNVKVIIYAPEEFPIYQWQRRKIFNNMGGKSLIHAERKCVLDYVFRLADVARVFSVTMQCKVIVEKKKLFDMISRHSQVIPVANAWTGNFQNMTKYRDYSSMKYIFNKGRDAVVECRNHNLGEWFGDSKAAGKLVATVNLRNQNYTAGRNASLEDWKNFFSDQFIKKNFHFIVFNDAENPVEIRENSCVTFCDRYILDNFRRLKTILRVGLHIGSVSGSPAIVIISDVPYLLIGAQSWGSWESALNPERFSIENDMLQYDKDKNHQLISFSQGRIKADFRLLLTAIFNSAQVLERYPAGFREKLATVLRDWS